MLNVMPNLFVICFKNGEIQYLENVSDYTVKNIGTTLALITINGQDVIYNFDEVKYMGKLYDLDHDEYNRLERVYKEGIKHD